MTVLLTANVSPTWNSGSTLSSLSTCPHWGPGSQKAPPPGVTQLGTGSATVRKTLSHRPPPPAQGPLACPPTNPVFSSQSAPSQLSRYRAGLWRTSQNGQAAPTWARTGCKSKWSPRKNHAWYEDLIWSHVEGGGKDPYVRNFPLWAVPQPVFQLSL